MIISIYLFLAVDPPVTLLRGVDSHESELTIFLLLRLNINYLMILCTFRRNINCGQIFITYCFRRVIIYMIPVYQCVLKSYNYTIQILILVSNV